MAERTYAGRTASERAAERRERLVAAGTEAFGTQGYAATTIEALCRAANVTARHFYEHFASREDLLLAAYEAVILRHREEVAAALVEAGVAPLQERVHAAVDGALRTWTADARTARLAFVEVVGVSPRVEARRQETVAEYVALVVAIADALHAEGLSAGPGRPLAARALVGALVGLVELWLVTTPHPPHDEMVAEAVTVALALLTS